MKLWQGKYHKELNDFAEKFNSSISFDQRLWKEDIEGSCAYAKMLGKQNIISEKDCADILQGLQSIASDLEQGKWRIKDSAEDIHTAIEEELTKRVGDAGKRLHTGRSRNDQVAVDFRMYVQKTNAMLQKALLSLENTLIAKAQKHIDTIMPGYTHLQVAQPVSFAHHLLAYAQMLERDISRLKDAYQRADSCPLGAGALATTTYPLDREFLQESLGFSSVMENSMDAVSDRDFVLENLYIFSNLMLHLSRLSEELILWNSQAYQFIEIDDQYSTGSSIMPQKKNPDMAELIRGKTGRVYGALIQLLTTFKALPLTYNKDMQEDKENFFDASDTCLQSVKIMEGMIATLRVKKENMRKACLEGFINATDVADYLAKKGMPFRDAYQLTGDLVNLCQEKGKTLESLPFEEYKKMSELFSEDIYSNIAIEKSLAERKVTGGPAPTAVKKQIKNLKKRLENQ